MTLQQLRYIVTIAETGNITEAARRLFVSQPSLTNSVHDLETEFQLTIFNLKKCLRHLSSPAPQPRALKNIGFVNFIFKGIRNPPVSNQVLVDFLNSV